MSQVTLPADFLVQFGALQRKVADLETRPVNSVPVYTTATRPPAAAVPNTVIRNTTTGTLQWSDGSVWTNS